MIVKFLGKVSSSEYEPNARDIHACTHTHTNASITQMLKVKFIPQLTYKIFNILISRDAAEAKHTHWTYTAYLKFNLNWNIVSAGICFDIMA